MSARMNVVLIGYMGFDGPGVIHLYHFAHELVRLGHRVLVIVDGDPGTVRLMAEPPAFPVLRMSWEGERLARTLLSAAEAFAPQVVHAWTPRHRPARCALEVAHATGAQIFIHYEDDEDYLYRYFARQLNADLLRDRRQALDSLLHPDQWMWQHPFFSTIANHYALGFSAICRPYVARLEKEWGKPVHLLYPGVDLARFNPDVQPVDRARYGIAGKTVLLYSGSLGRVHSFDQLLEAFAPLARRWPDTVLVQLGRNYVAEELQVEIRRLNLSGRVFFLGPIEHREIHRFLALGDILLQSGTPGDFDEYRLPSKLPEYFAMGRPVVTFAHGIGREFEDGVNVLKMYGGDSAEMGACIERLLADGELRARLGQAGRSRAEELFSWPRNAAGLAQFYADALAGRVQADEGAAARHWPAFYLPPDAPPAGDRRLLLVASDALPLPGLDGGPSGCRAAALAAALEAEGHRVVLAMPVDACAETFDLQPYPRVRLWNWRTLGYVIERSGADGVVLFGYPALDGLLRTPAVLVPAAADLCGETLPAPEGVPPGERVAALARTRGALVAGADEQAAWLPWALAAGCPLLRAPAQDGAGAEAGRLLQLLSAP